MPPADLLQVARSQLGELERPPGSNSTKYGQWYGLDPAAWCAMFVSWCAANSGNADVIPRFAYCPTGADWFQGKGLWQHSPSVGAIVFYDTAGLGRVSHVGIVETVLASGRWYAIEGNTNGQGSRTGGEVRRQLRSTVGTSRGGFGRPVYSGQLPSGWPPYGGALLRRGSTGAAVRTAQGALNRVLAHSGRPPIGVDGLFGPATAAAVIWFQLLRGLGPDGIIGPATWAALGV